MSRGLNDFYYDYVYRVLRPDEDPNNDLTCVNSCSPYTIDKHVESGLHIPTRFISTTTSMDKARKWMTTADNITSRKYRNKRSVIVRIDIELIKRKYPNVANSAYDLTNSSNLNHFLKNSKQKSFACAYSEIVFERYIPSEAVSVCYTTKDGYVNSENKKACVTRAIPSEAVLPRTTQPVLFPNDYSDQLRRAAESNLRKSSNLEAKSLKSCFRSNQVPDQFDYSGYGNVSEYEKGYRPSKVALPSQASRTRQTRDLNSATFETKRASYERSYLSYKEVLSQEGRKRDKIVASSTNFGTAISSRPNIPTGTLRPNLHKDLSEPKDYSNYDERSCQPHKLEVSGRRVITHDRIRQSSTDFGTTGYSRPSQRTNWSSPGDTPDAPRNKPLWMRVLSFLFCPFSRVNNER